MARMASHKSAQKRNQMVFVAEPRSKTTNSSIFVKESRQNKITAYVVFHLTAYFKISSNK